MSKFDEIDFRARHRGLALRPAAGPAWPIDPVLITETGDTVTRDRNGRGRPHKGLDIFANAGSPIRAARRGIVIRVVDGRTSNRASAQRAGLFVDVMGVDGLVYRYLHLGDVVVASRQRISAGAVIGNIAAAYTSGLTERPHLHFEIRAADFEQVRGDYGAPLNPLRLRPPLNPRRA